jgi:serine/threonine-protein kinase HipA
MEKDAYASHMRELFRRMVFNILIDNTDDHEKNHALLMTDSQQYELSPAYDVLPSGQGLGFQQFRVGEQEADSTLTNALSMSQQFGLDRDEAAKEAGVVARVVDRWQQHFKECAVTRGDIALCAEQIDRPFPASAGSFCGADARNRAASRCRPQRRATRRA